MTRSNPSKSLFDFPHPLNLQIQDFLRSREKPFFCCKCIICYRYWMISIKASSIPQFFQSPCYNCCWGESLRYSKHTTRGDKRKQHFIQSDNKLNCWKYGKQAENFRRKKKKKFHWCLFAFHGKHNKWKIPSKIVFNDFSLWHLCFKKIIANGIFFIHLFVD